MEQPVTANLIPASKVSGTSVYNNAGESIGEISDVMMDKESGKVVYAVMSFGGFLGMGEKYHPLPWSLLKYNSTQGGYVVDISKEQLQGAPAYEEGADPGWGNRDYENKLNGYYGVEPYWAGALGGGGLAGGVLGGMVGGPAAVGGPSGGGEAEPGGAARPTGVGRKGPVVP